MFLQTAFRDWKRVNFKLRTLSPAFKEKNQKQKTKQKKQQQKKKTNKQMIVTRNDGFCLM